MNEQIAKGLLEAGAVYVSKGGKSPFRLTSGKLSPVYVDCRRLISYPKLRDQITQQFAKIVEEEIGSDLVEVIAGGETAGIPFAAFLAIELRKPMIYVRKEPKGYGKSAQIEGVLEEGNKVILVEDLVTDGGSKLKFKEGIEAASGILEHCLCVFEYRCDTVGLKEAREKLLGQGVKLFSLVTWDDIFALALREGYLTQEEQQQVLEFLEDPSGWR